MNHKLEVDSIQLSFDQCKILSDIYLNCETGKITGLLGRNGQGKSCLLQIIYGSLKCEKFVRIDNLILNEAYKRSDLLSYMPQFNFIPKRLSVIRVFKDFDLDYSIFHKIFPEFISRKWMSIGSLSGGDLRLVELYVILKSTSQFAMLDEPFTHLNPIQIEKVKEIFLEEKEKKGLLITDHMFRHVLDICDNLYVLVNWKTRLD